MELKDFETHRIWVVVADCEYQLGVLQESGDRISSAVETEMRGRLAWLQSVYRSRGRSHFLFTVGMLDEVDRHLQAAFSNLETAMQYSGGNRISFAESARAQVEEALRTAIRDWPSPTPTAREVEQGESIVEALLAAQKKALDTFEQAYQERREQLTDLDEKAAKIRMLLQAAEAEIGVDVERAVAAVDAQRARIDTVIDDGAKAIASIAPSADAQFDKWAEKQNENFDAIFGPRAERADVAATQADSALAKIVTIENKYQKLVHLDSADRLAGHYDREAAGLRLAAVISYLVGVASIVAAAVPLGMMIAGQLNGTPDQATAPFNWGTLATRALFAILLGGVATVAVRVAGRLLAQASACKRFAMEMRTFEPFLSGAEEGAVNDARLALVAEAFGKAYVGRAESTATPGAGEEVVNLGAVEKVVDLMTRLASRGA